MNKYNVRIGNDNKGYYIYIIDNDLSIYSADEDIIELLGINKEMYNDIMLHKFKGEKLKGEIFFNSEDNVINAIEWLEENLDYFIIAKQLTEGEN